MEKQYKLMSKSDTISDNFFADSEIFTNFATELYIGRTLPVQG